MTQLVGGVSGAQASLGGGLSSTALRVVDIPHLNQITPPTTLAPTSPFIAQLGRFRRHLNGTTIDAVGNVLAGALVRIFNTLTDALVASFTSAADGSFDAPIYAEGATYYVYAEKAGSPEVFGASTNQLTPL